MLKRIFSSALKIFFNLLYHQFSWMYDWIADLVSVGLWKEWVQAVIPYLEGKKVLEIGCGPGHLLAALSTGGGSIFGLDVSQQMLRQANRNISLSPRNKNLVLAASQNLPLVDRCFPAIVATFPSNYILDPKTLDGIWRVLDEGGKLLILPAAWIEGSNILDRLAAWLFTITDESPRIIDTDIEVRFSGYFERLSHAGFQSTWELIESDRSKILIITAVKNQPNK